MRPRSGSAARKFLVGLLGLFGLALAARDASAQMLGDPSSSASPAQSTSSGQSALAAPSATPPGRARGESPHALALRARWVTVPGWELAPYTNAHTELLGGWSLGLEYLYRRAGFDVVISLDYSSLNASDGNFLGKGNDPATETHFLHFDGLSALSVDVSLIGHWNLTKWMEFRLGAGLGIGGVFGNIYQITSNGCTADNANDSTVCYPKNIGPITQSDAALVQKLENARCSEDFTDGGKDTPQNPCYRRTETYPFNARVVPVLNALIGFRFKLHQMAYLHLETGWRLVGFYLGGGPEIRF